MIEQKKNKVCRAASLALVLTLVTTCLLSYTLAKYTTSVSGTDTARVAKFDFGSTITTKDEEDNTLSNGVMLTTAAAPIDVFSTSYKSASTSLGTASTTTVDGGSAKVVAPGIFGSFQYAFTGTSEVSLKISFDIAETNNAAVPILYKYNSLYYSNQYAKGTHYFVLDNNGSAITTVNVAGNLADLATAVSTGIGVINAGTALSTLTADTTVTWYWPFEEWSAASGGTLITGTGVGTDAYDTALGKLGTDIVTLNIAATATQVD